MRRLLTSILLALTVIGNAAAQGRDAEAINAEVLRLHQAGRSAEAEPLAREALTLRERQFGPAHPDVATSLNNLGLLLHAQGRYLEAEPLFRRSQEILERVLGPEHAAVALLLNNVGELLRAQGRYAEAEPHYRRSLAIDEKGLGSEHPSIARSLNNLALLFQSQGRYSEAEALYRRSLTINEKALGPTHPHVASTLNNLGLLFKVQGRYADAEPHSRQSLAIYEKSLGANHPDVVSPLVNLAAILQDQGRYADAEALYRRGLSIDEMAFGLEHPFVAISTLNIAGLARAQGRLTDAEIYFRRSLFIFEKALGPTHPHVASALWNLAYLLERQGRDDAALHFYRRSLLILAGRFDRLDEGGEREVSSLSEQRLWSGAFLGHIGVAVRIAVAAPAAERDRLQDEAFQLLDRAKATATGAAVARMAARFASGTNALAGLAREQQDAAGQLAAADAALVRAAAQPPQQRDAASEEALRARAAALQQRIAATAGRLRADFPAYAEIAAPKPLAVAAAQALLGADEALVAFAVGADASWVFVLRRDRLVATQVALAAADLASAVRALRAGLDPTGKADLGDLAPFEARRAYELYASLFGPALPLLDGVRHLFVVLDGALDSLPVGVLLTEPPAKARFAPSDAASFRGAAWLGQRMAVSVLPSVGSLWALRRFARAAKAAQPFLGIGDPILKDHPGDPAARRVAKPVSTVAWTVVEERPSLRSLFRGAIADVRALRDAPSLPDTADELAAMATSLGARNGSLLLREAATESAVKRAALADRKVLAFATHGVVAGEMKGLVEPALILTPPAEATTDDDGLLTASEVAQLKLDADWVILSACNTAAADGTPGAAGLSGLARAFFYAGARALLVSHWPVVSEAAVALTTTMLREAALPDVTRAEAHRRAVAALIGGAARPEFAHPVYWAPFVVVGEGGAGSPAR